jgi:membrane fusion protein (multidrug efflux system)
MTIRGRSMAVTIRWKLIVACFPLLALPACHEAHGEEHHEHHKIVTTNPVIRDVETVQQYVCQIHSQRHIRVCALEGGYLEPVPIREGQTVKKGQVLFTIVPTLYKSRLDAELAEVRLAQLELDNTKRLMDQKVVSSNEVALFEAKLAKAQAKAKLAEAELNFTKIEAPFDGIVDRIHEQHGTLVKEGEVLTTLSDNSVMWAYFNVPESRYLEYMAATPEQRGSSRIDLVLANGQTFRHPGAIGAIEAKFNNETGNIPFRADYPNPEGLLRHGQTGNVLIRRTTPRSLVIPQRATFEILDKRYVFVVDDQQIVHQREVQVLHELEDLFVIKGGLRETDKIVIEGVRQVHDGEKKECEHRPAGDVNAQLKHRAE